MQITHPPTSATTRGRGPAGKKERPNLRPTFPILPQKKGLFENNELEMLREEKGSEGERRLFSRELSREDLVGDCARLI